MFSNHVRIETSQLEIMLYDSKFSRAPVKSIWVLIFSDSLARELDILKGPQLHKSNKSMVYSTI